MTSPFCFPRKAQATTSLSTVSAPATSSERSSSPSPSGSSERLSSIASPSPPSTPASSPSPSRVVTTEKSSIVTRFAMRCKRAGSGFSSSPEEIETRLFKKSKMLDSRSLALSTPASRSRTAWATQTASIVRTRRAAKMVRRARKTPEWKPSARETTSTTVQAIPPPPVLRVLAVETESLPSITSSSTASLAGRYKKTTAGKKRFDPTARPASKQNKSPRAASPTTPSPRRSRSKRSSLVSVVPFIRTVGADESVDCEMSSPGLPSLPFVSSSVARSPSFVPFPSVVSYSTPFCAFAGTSEYASALTPATPSRDNSYTNGPDACNVASFVEPVEDASLMEIDPDVVLAPPTPAVPFTTLPMQQPSTLVASSSFAASPINAFDAFASTSGFGTNCIPAVREGYRSYSNAFSGSQSTSFTEVSNTVDVDVSEEFNLRSYAKNTAAKVQSAVDADEDPPDVILFSMSCGIFTLTEEGAVTDPKGGGTLEVLGPSNPGQPAWFAMCSKGVPGKRKILLDAALPDDFSLKVVKKGTNTFFVFDIVDENGTKHNHWISPLGDAGDETADNFVEAIKRYLPWVVWT